MKRFAYPTLVLAFASTLMAAPQDNSKKAPVTPTPVATVSTKGPAAAKDGVKGKAKGKQKKGAKAKNK